MRTQDAPERSRALGIVEDGLDEGRRLDFEGVDLAEGCGGRRAGLALEHAQLADHCAGAEVGQDDRLKKLGVRQLDPDAALEDDVQ